MQNTTLKFVRPRLHITARWLNDPCAPFYDPRSKLYHLFYQCNPAGVGWGNVSWGHVTSKDLLHWTFMPKQPALGPDQKYDKDGAFTGNAAPIGKDGNLHVFYSSICQLPFHWSTPPYPRNCAGLSMAMSKDGGKTWIKSSKNPILLGEPEGLEVSGYRDPYIAPWKQLDELRGTNSQLYGLVSGGVEGEGPTSFLYVVDPKRLDKWQYLGPLVDLPLRWNPSEKWSGNMGVNWECVNFITLPVEANNSTKNIATLDFLIVGAEGDTERADIKSYKLPKNLPPRNVRTQLWIQGDLRQSSLGDIRFQHNRSGLLDHGTYYAADSFVDPKTSRRVVYGWITEEDCSLKHAAQKGWNGCLALPREVFVQSISNVVRALRTPLSEITGVIVEGAVRQTRRTTYTVRTMGVRPLAELNQLRNSALHIYQVDSISLDTKSNFRRHIAQTTTPTWELEAIITINPRCESIGLIFKHSTDLSIHTKLTFDIPQEKITLDRSKSISHPSLLTQINTCPDSGPFTLFTQRNPNSNTEELEKLHVRIFNDGDVLEVFVNDRFAIGTVVYTGAHETCGGIIVFAAPTSTTGNKSAEQPVASVDSIAIWDGLNANKSLIDGWEHIGVTEPV